MQILKVVARSKMMHSTHHHHQKTCFQKRAKTRFIFLLYEIKKKISLQACNNKELAQNNPVHVFNLNTQLDSKSNTFLLYIFIIQHDLVLLLKDFDFHS